MEYGHDYRAPLGYPIVAAERLLEHGVGIEFSRWFAVRFEDLPDMQQLARHVRLSGPPDVVLLHLGAVYCRHVIFVDGPLTMEVRDELGRRFPDATYACYGVMRRLAWVLGRQSNEYLGSEALERFLLEVRGAWPDARIALLLPFPGVLRSRAQERTATRLHADMMAASKRIGTDLLRFRDVLGTDPVLRCANRYNLNARGSQLVGAELARWLLAHRPPRLGANSQIPDASPIADAPDPV
jgi:hypothetical protein